MRRRCQLGLFAIMLCACGTNEPTGPAAVIGVPFRLVSVNGQAVPAQYYAEFDYQATVISGSIVFLPNGFVRASANVHIERSVLPDEDVTTLDSVPYRLAGSLLLVHRNHGWDTAQISGGLRVRWTTGAGSMGEWLYLKD